MRPLQSPHMDTGRRPQPQTPIRDPVPLGAGRKQSAHRSGIGLVALEVTARQAAAAIADVRHTDRDVAE